MHDAIIGAVSVVSDLSLRMRATRQLGLRARGEDGIADQNCILVLDSEAIASSRKAVPEAKRNVASR